MLTSRWFFVSVTVITAFTPRFALADMDTNGKAALAKSNLHLTAPIERWDEAVPLGNGLLGGLLRFRDPFDSGNANWNHPDITRSGKYLECCLAPGEVLEGSL